LDTLTHGFVPYAVFTLLKRPRIERVAAAIGAMSPDADVLWAWLSHAHDHAYPLVHRGFSHTLWGAPILATIALFILANQPMARRGALFENVWFTRGTILPLWIGAWSHLLLDGVTITGIPLLWPLSNTRFTTDWFFFGVPYLAPLSLVAWILILRRKASDRFIRIAFVVLVAILLAAGSIRAYSYPKNLVGDEDVTPGPVEWEWIVSRNTPEGVTVYATGWGGVEKPSRFYPHVAYVESEEARRACEGTAGIIPWSWSLWGLPIVHAEKEDATWKITYRDAGQIYDDETRDLRWSDREDPAERDEARCTVDPQGNVSFDRDRGWVGS
jgi:membrane-bound metal-dependent hydrolase YbcI (DUF457 family)